LSVRGRIKWTLFATQSLGSAGFLISSTVTPIVGAALSGRPSWAGVPAFFYWSGGAACAVLWGRLMDLIGRRRTMATGLTIGILGATIAALSIRAGSFWSFTGGLILMGGANTAVQLGRFVAAEVHPQAERGRAIATVVMGGTVGGILGPLLVAPAAQRAQALALPELLGPYVVSLVFFALGAIVVTALLRPEPRDLALDMERARIEADPTAAPHPARAVGEILRDRWVQVAMLSMLLAQGVMSMLMVISSLHMKDHHHSLGHISAVMSSHVIGMYAFSLVTGRLADRWGRARLIATGAGILIVAGIGAIWSIALLPMAAVLLLLGLGWNLCYVGGSTLLSDRLSQVERSRIAGINDSLLTGASAVGSLLSGVVFAAVGYAAMGGAVALVATIPLALGWRFRDRSWTPPAGPEPAP
jgi:MFS family permease